MTKYYWKRVKVQLLFWFENATAAPRIIKWGEKGTRRNGVKRALKMAKTRVTSFIVVSSTSIYYIRTHFDDVIPLSNAPQAIRQHKNWKQTNAYFSAMPYESSTMARGWKLLGFFTLGFRYHLCWNEYPWPNLVSSWLDLFTFCCGDIIFPDRIK